MKLMRTELNELDAENQRENGRRARYVGEHEKMLCCSISNSNPAPDDM